MGSLNFCCRCGDWLGASEGQIRLDDDNEPVIVYSEYQTYEVNPGESFAADLFCGMLDDE